MEEEFSKIRHTRTKFIYSRNSRRANLGIEDNSNQVSIGPTGWLDIGNIIKSIKSPDSDGSEQLFILLSSIDEKGENIPFPIDSKISTLNGVYTENLWEIAATESNSLKLYLGIIDELLKIKIGGGLKRVQIL